MIDPTKIEVLAIATNELSGRASGLLQRARANMAALGALLKRRPLPCLPGRRGGGGGRGRVRAARELNEINRHFLAKGYEAA